MASIQFMQFLKSTLWSHYLESNFLLHMYFEHMYICLVFNTYLLSTRFLEEIKVKFIKWLLSGKEYKKSEGNFDNSFQKL